MKTLVSVIVGIVIAYLAFFQFDSWLVQKIVEMIGVESNNLGLAKLIIWCVVLFFSAGLTFWLAALAGIFVRLILAD